MNYDLHLVLDGLGIALFSAKKMEYVTPGSDFFTAEFDNPKQIAAYLNQGDITAFCTGSGGDFDLHFLSGAPSAEILEQYPVSVRLGLEVQGGSIQVCDVYWLMKWDANFPQEQIIPLEDGFYEITVCTRLPESGYWGEDQTIYLFFEKAEHMPELSWRGIPDLFTEDEEE